MAKFAAKWLLKDTKNFDEYMKAVGVGMVMRKMGGTAKPSQDIKIDGDKYTIKTESLVKNTLIEFKLGEQFDETTADGRKVKSTITLEGDNKLIHKQEGDIPSTLTRVVDPEDTMTMTLEAGTAVCTRVYKKE